MRNPAIFLLFLLLSLPSIVRAQAQQIAHIGDLKLEGGGVIKDCVVGYRTFGRLNPDKSDVVIMPTAFGWESAALASRIGKGKLVDSATYFVIAIDSLGDGISSSPSNSKAQPGLDFPRFSIRDMVNAEQQLLTTSLHFSHIHAVLGFSMGGMQAFQWAVSYPGFADKIVSIAGSPQLTSYDMLVWRTSELALQSDPDWKAGKFARQPPLHLLNMVQMLVLQTPSFIVKNTPRAQYNQFESQLVQGPDDMDANDTLRQIQALLTDDVAAEFGGSLQNAAASVRSKTLVIVNKQDHLVNPLPSIEFAGMLHASLIELDSECGHRAHSCEMNRIGTAVAAFLAN
jgi:homoserine O-acetyltransferase/O-succinyltransferase